MHCPECGQFMARKLAPEVGRDVHEEAAFWWECQNWDDCYAAAHGEVIAAPEYNWLYMCSDIPGEHMRDWKGLLDEYITMFRQMPASHRVRFLRRAQQAVTEAGGSIFSLSV